MLIRAFLDGLSTCFLTAAFAWGSLAGCARSPPQPEHLVPRAAELLIAVDVAALTGSPLFSTGWAHLEHEPAARSATDALRACGLSPAKWQHLLIGADANFHSVLVIGARHIGKPDRWRCVVERLAPRDIRPHDMTLRVREDDALIWALGEHRAIGHSVGPHLIAWSDPEWAPQVQRLAQGKGPSVVAGVLAPLMARVDRSHAIWAVARVPADPPPRLDLPSDGATALTVEMDLRHGVRMEATVQFGTEAQSARATDELRIALDAARPLAAWLRMPTGVLDAVQLHHTRELFHLDLRLRPQDVSALANRLKPGMDLPPH